VKPYGRNKDHHFVFDWLGDTNSTGFGDERAMNELVHFLGGNRGLVCPNASVGMGSRPDIYCCYLHCKVSEG
jgi:hypothetical protein